MTDYRKISWQSTKKKGQRMAGGMPCDEVDAILDMCSKIIPNKTIQKRAGALVEERSALHEAHKKIIAKIAQLPFLIAFVVWVKEVASLQPSLLNASKMLLEHNFIGAADKKGVLWTISDAHGFDHRVIIDAIRCQHEIALQVREDLVIAYLAFIQWLSQETHGYISIFEDPDLHKIKGKVLPFSQFIAFLSALKEKEQLVAKLLYYGGTPTLDEVLKIQLQDVNFEKKLIRYESQLIKYPTHIFADIQSLVGKKTQGRLFLGRQNAPLSSSRIFRNFKEAALKVGLAPSFSPAVLTSSQ